MTLYILLILILEKNDEKNYLSLLVIILLPFLMACDQSVFEQDQKLNVLSVTKKESIASYLSHSISMDSIKVISLKLPAMLGMKKNRGVDRSIKEIIPLSYFMNDAPKTRGVEEESISDCIYIINYEENQGFAIVSKDTRIPTVLGYSDKGNIVSDSIWGWSSRSGDGYFESGIFIPSQPVISENPASSNTIGYRNNVKIIKNLRA